jgi:two-component system, NarL family, nitrate/nitrite response regulator NarL
MSALVTVPARPADAVAAPDLGAVAAGRSAASHVTRRRVSVALADSHPLTQDTLERTLRSWPEFDLRYVVSDAAVIELLRSASARVLVVDPVSIGISGQELLQAADGRSRIVVITFDPTAEQIYELLTHGVVGLLGKDCRKREVCDAVAAAARGDVLIGASVQPLLARELRLRRTGADKFLTTRELQVLKLMATGLNAPDVAARLEIGTATVKTHQSHIYERLEVHDGKAALVKAMRLGFIE